MSRAHGGLMQTEGEDSVPVPKLLARRRLSGVQSCSEAGLADRQTEEFIAISEIFQGAVEEIGLDQGSTSSSSSSSGNREESDDCPRPSTPSRRYKVKLTARSDCSNAGITLTGSAKGEAEHAELEICYGRLYPYETPMLKLHNIDWLPKAAQDELHHKLWEVVVDNSGQECIYAACTAVLDVLRDNYDPRANLSLLLQMRLRQEDEEKQRLAAERKRKEQAEQLAEEERRAAERELQKQMLAERERLIRFEEKRRAAERIGEGGRGGNLDFLPGDDSEASGDNAAKMTLVENANGMLGNAGDFGETNCPSAVANGMNHKANSPIPATKGKPSSKAVRPIRPAASPPPQTKISAHCKHVDAKQVASPKRCPKQDPMPADTFWPLLEESSPGQCISGRFADIRNPHANIEDESADFFLCEDSSAGGVEIVFEESRAEDTALPTHKKVASPALSPAAAPKVAPPTKTFNPPPKSPPLAPAPTGSRALVGKQKLQMNKSAAASKLATKLETAGAEIGAADMAAAGAQAVASPRGQTGGGSRYATDFEELKFLGKGGFGSVTKVRHRVDQQIYAIKRIALAGPDSSRERLVQECALLPRFTHMHIVRYYQAWIEVEEAPAPVPQGKTKKATKRRSMKLESTDGGRHARDDWLSHPGDDGAWGKGRNANLHGTTREYLFIQMEYCDGTTLRELIDSGELLKDEVLIWKLFRQILDALAYVHSKGLIHRDLKPANVFLSKAEKGQAKLGDFGLTTEVQSASSPRDTKDASSNSRKDKQQSTAVGTPYYMAPEVRRGTGWQQNSQETNQSRVYDQKADMFSLGVIFFEMWNHPFATAMERYYTLDNFSEGLLQSHHSRLQELLPKATPKEVAEILILLLRREPVERIAAEDLLHRSGLLPAGAFDPQIERVLKAVENPSSAESVALIQALFCRSEEVAKDVSFFEQLFRGSSEQLDVQLEARDSALQLLRDLCRRHGAVFDLCPLVRPSRHATADAAAPAAAAGSVSSPRSAVVPPRPGPLRGCHMVDAGNTLIELRTNLTEPFARAAAARIAAHVDDDDDTLTPFAFGSRRRYHTGTVYREAPPSEASATSQFGHPREISSAVVEFTWWPVASSQPCRGTNSSDAVNLNVAEVATAQAQEVEFLHLLAEFMAAAGLDRGRAELRLTDSRLLPLVLECALLRSHLRIEGRPEGFATTPSVLKSTERSSVSEGRLEKLRLRLVEALRCQATIGMTRADSGPLSCSSQTSQSSLPGGSSGILPGIDFDRIAAELAILLGGGNASSIGSEPPKSAATILYDLEEFCTLTAGTQAPAYMEFASSSPRTAEVVQQLRELFEGLKLLIRSIDNLIDVTFDALLPLDLDTYGPGLGFYIHLRDSGGTVAVGGRTDNLLARFTNLHGLNVRNVADDEMTVDAGQNVNLPRGLTAEIAMDKIANSLVEAAQSPILPAGQHDRRRRSSNQVTSAPGGAIASTPPSQWWMQASSSWTYVLVDYSTDDGIQVNGTAGRGTDDIDSALFKEVIFVASGLWRSGARCEVRPRGTGPLDPRAIFESRQTQLASASLNTGTPPDFVLTIRHTSADAGGAPGADRNQSVTIRYCLRALSDVGLELMERATKELGVREFEERTKLFEFLERLARRKGFRHPGLSIRQIHDQ